MERGHPMSVRTYKDLILCDNFQRLYLNYYAYTGFRVSREYRIRRIKLITWSVLKKYIIFSAFRNKIKVRREREGEKERWRE